MLGQLGVERGVVAITKSDVGEPELAAEEAAELVPGTPVVQVSAHRRTGLDELLAALADADEFEDLPGKWQAAILAAEGGEAEGAEAHGGGCCGGHGARDCS